MAAINSIFDLVNLSGLPLPQIIEEPLIQDIFTDLLTQFQTINPDYTLLLESDPIAKFLEAQAYRELILRQRLNAVARANLLAFAAGSDLDHLGAFYDVARLVVQAANNTVIPNIPLITEDDDRYRYRIQLKTSAPNTGGPEASYKFWAMTADTRVEDVSVWSPDEPNGFNMGGRVNISILSTEGNGTPSDSLMSIVSAVLFRNDIKTLSDLLSVDKGIPVTVNVTASVILLPRTPYAVFQNLLTSFPTAFAKFAGLGTDIAASWVSSQLQVAGVHSVLMTAPAANTTITIAPNEFPIAGTFSISFGGFSDGESARLTEAEERRVRQEVYSYYLSYCIQVRRTQAQIQADLVYKDVTGIIQPTVQGFAEFLLLDNRFNASGNYLPEDELCFLIYRRLFTTLYPAPS